MKITKSQLAEAIKKEVSRLHKINIMENRLSEIKKELKLLREGSIFEMSAGILNEKQQDELKFINLIQNMGDNMTKKQAEDMLATLMDSLTELELELFFNKYEESMPDIMRDEIQQHIWDMEEFKSHYDNRPIRH